MLSVARKTVLRLISELTVERRHSCNVFHFTRKKRCCYNALLSGDPFFIGTFSERLQNTVITKRNRIESTCDPMWLKSSRIVIGHVCRVKFLSRDVVSGDTAA